MRFAFKSVNFEESRWQVTLHYVRGPHPRGCVKEVTWQEWGGHASEGLPVPCVLRGCACWVSFVENLISSLHMHCLPWCVASA